VYYPYSVQKKIGLPIIEKIIFDDTVTYSLPATEKRHSP